MTDKFNNFRAPTHKLEDEDLPRIGHEIGVGEDVIHAVIEVEAAGTGADSKGRMKMLYEPHVAYRCAPTKAIRDRLVDAGLAYKDWKKGYPKDSYPRLLKAMAIDETTALKACSWGLPQILGENFAMAGYPTIQAMVTDFTLDEDNQIEAMIEFVKSAHLDDELRAVEKKIRAGKRIVPDDARAFVRGYNGSGYEKNDYHTKFATAVNKWVKIPDTVWSPEVTVGVGGAGGAGPKPQESAVVVQPGAPGAATGDTPLMPEVVQVQEAPKTVNIYDGKYHTEIEAMQRDLNRLGYPEFGEIDGKWGTKTRAAMLAFRADNGLPLVPYIDEKLTTALSIATPRYVNPARAEATAKDLVEKGATDVKVTQNVGLIGKILAFFGIGGGVAEAVDAAKQYSGTAKEAAGWIDPVRNFVQANFWLIAIAVGLFFAWRASQLIRIRVEKHRTGEDVST